ncbi:hypothetical protein [Pectobacterium atrosepticum]|uniref:hypothetical protein n=1 Tax=Pectobacterium atrosepticum TaxID=29471 RepID=UPI000500CE5D|nr:hypothetical protein [Pectobacterium atrosepticum]KFX10719.1 hypothetical protein JV34_22615 [Pectobacterium atrosepticum]
MKKGVVRIESWMPNEQIGKVIRQELEQSADAKITVTYVRNDPLHCENDFFNFISDKTRIRMVMAMLGILTLATVVFFINNYL